MHVDPAAGWFPHYLGFADETGAGAARAPTATSTLAPGTGDEGWVAAVADLAAWASEQRRARRSWWRSAWTPPAAIRRARSTVTAAGFRAAGRALGALGLPTVVVQEGGYDLDEIGRLVLEALRESRRECVAERIDLGRQGRARGRARPAAQGPQAAAALAARGGGRARRGRARSRSAPTGASAVLIEDARDLGRVAARPRAAGAPERLTTGRDPMPFWEDVEPRLSPDGATVAYADDGHVWLVPRPAAARRASWSRARARCGRPTAGS